MFWISSPLLLPLIKNIFMIVNDKQTEETKKSTTAEATFAYLFKMNRLRASDVVVNFFSIKIFIKLMTRMCVNFK